MQSMIRAFGRFATASIPTEKTAATQILGYGRFAHAPQRAFGFATRRWMSSLQSPSQQQTPSAPQMPPSSPIGTIFKYAFGAAFFGGIGYVSYEVYNDPNSVMEKVEDMHSIVDSMAKPIQKQLLPEPLPEQEQPLTLVVDLEGFLVHSVWNWKHGWRTMKRPYVDYFLDEMSKYYEIVLFTRESMFSGGEKAKKLDPDSRIMFGLFRESTLFENNKHYKDLSYLNRDPAKVICFDLEEHADNKHPENTVFLKSWNGDPKDTYLKDIVPFLIELARAGVDARVALKHFEGKDIPQAFEEERLEAQRRREERMQRRSAITKSFLGRK